MPPINVTCLTLTPLPQVWSAASLSLLLRAREQAELRRREWEEWAVERWGSLQAAYSNPR